MSSHVHWVTWSGVQPPARFLHPLHVGFARWLNRETGARGPVFAERFRDIVFEGETAATLVAYVHNNPVRAGVVASAADSGWTSHRAYLGLEPAPPWLDVAGGLLRCGFEPTTAGRLRFDDFVRGCAGTPRTDAFSARDLEKRRAEERARLGPIELATPVVKQAADGLRVDHTIVAPPARSGRLASSVTIDEVLERVSAITALSLDALRSGSRQRRCAAGRRLALRVWRRLGRPATELARVMGIGKGAASQQLSRYEADAELCAELIAESLTRAWGAGITEQTEHRPR